jgi:hypothetical protein
LLCDAGGNDFRLALGLLFIAAIQPGGVFTLIDYWRP